MRGQTTAPALGRRPLRIAEAWQKVLVVVGCLVLRFATLWILGVLKVPAADFIYFAEGVAMVAFCTRTFRVREEPLVPSRPWWRGTGRPFAGYLIGFLVIVSVGVQLASFLVDYDAALLVDTLLGVVSGLLIAAYFLHSSIRLRKSPRDPSLIPGKRSDW